MNLHTVWKVANDYIQKLTKTVVLYSYNDATIFIACVLTLFYSYTILNNFGGSVSVSSDFLDFQFYGCGAVLADASMHDELTRIRSACYMENCTSADSDKTP